MDLRTYLFKNRITQVEFASRMGVSKTHIYNIIHGKTDIRIAEASAIEKATGGAVTLYDWTQGSQENEELGNV